MEDHGSYHTQPRTVTGPRQTVPEQRRTVSEPSRTVPEQRRTVPEPRRTVPEPRRTVSEPRRTVPEPRKTVPEGPRTELEARHKKITTASSSSPDNSRAKPKSATIEFGSTKDNNRIGKPRTIFEESSSDTRGRKTIKKGRDKDRDATRRGDIWAVDFDDEFEMEDSDSTWTRGRRRDERKRRRVSREERTYRFESSEKQTGERNRRSKRDLVWGRRKEQKRNTRRRKFKTESGDDSNKESMGLESIFRQSNTDKEDRIDFSEPSTDSIDPAGSHQPQSLVPTQLAPVPTTVDGGWTVIQRRQNGKVNFTRPWEDYAAGFGAVERGEDHWLGNEALHHLTKLEPMELKIIMEDVFSSVWEATYSKFRVAGRGDNYRVQVSFFYYKAIILKFSFLDRGNA